MLTLIHPNGNLKRRADLHLISSDDLVYEQDILRDSSSVKPWLAYISLKGQHGSACEQNLVMARACAQLPRSYKLWKLYLNFRIKHVSKLNPVVFATEYQKVNRLFEKALILLNKMPRIWEKYLRFLMKQPLVTVGRRTFDRALRALPITQHNRIWPIYLSFANAASGQTAVRVWRRYMQVHPEESEDFIELLVKTGGYTEAAMRYMDLVNNVRFSSKRGKGHYELWSDMVDLVVEHALDIDTGYETGLDVERIIRSGISRFVDQRGKLWVGLATYWIRRGSFERARDMFEEGITTAVTARDFSFIYQAYIEFEESVIHALMEKDATSSEQGIVDVDANFDLDIRMMRLKHLIDRRPFLLNDVLLRQNPNQVSVWEKRVKLWDNNNDEVVKTFTTAISTIDPKRAAGPLHKLWSDYARFYQKGGDMRNARIIMEKAVKVPYKSVDELADTWIQWARMELDDGNINEANRIMNKAVQGPLRSRIDYFDETLSPQQRVHKSWKLWSFYVDLMERTSTLDEVRTVYERIFELGIATPQTVVNYANLLEEREYYEDSFKVYERGLSLFEKDPIINFELWNLYLSKAMDRNIDIERLRDLFEQAVRGCPPKFAKRIYIMYGNMEEERGLVRHAMRIYERATREVADEDRADMFNFHITKMASNFGLPSTRPIYESAITALPDSEAKDMCVKFADMEKRLGEIDRARAIYKYASQFCDPRTNGDFWEYWKKFEEQHGNEDTFKEMLRIKRSVEQQHNKDVNFIASQALVRGQQTAGQSADAMSQLERDARAPEGFVAASTGPQGGMPVQPAKTSNPDAIDLDD
ncbi:hypothetical protein CDD82_1569 [Ophiocordyceps australis]|uniref:Pre-mRNA-splicing factor SYF1 n=1 Tax=Ophiocordyceps australis TaxID=1399860 RepID=A0A2C5YFD4_9HYPO|nr:hypothetical protein CDD82_1569 [Ophiocordyceps australis]